MIRVVGTRRRARAYVCVCVYGVLNVVFDKLTLSESITVLSGYHIPPLIKFGLFRDINNDPSARGPKCNTV